MKKFLREPGGADIYPELEIKWKRGSDPELQVRHCSSPRDPRRPRAEAGAETGAERSEPVAVVNLAPYDQTQLHYLMQCHGLVPSRTTKATPSAASRKEACDLVPPDRWAWARSGVVPGLLVVLGLLAILGLSLRGLRGGVLPCRWLGAAGARGRGGVGRRKAKKEDVSQPDSAPAAELRPSASAMTGDPDGI